MSDPTSRLVADIVQFARPLPEFIAHARLLPPSETVTYLQLEQAKSAVYGYLTRRSTNDELLSWARFLLGRRDVVFPPEHYLTLLELLEAISFSASGRPFGPHEAETWVTVLDLADT